MNFAKFGWNELSGSVEDVFKFCQRIFAISLSSSIGKGWDPTFEQFESLSPKDALFQVWLK